MRISKIKIRKASVPQIKSRQRKLERPNASFTTRIRPIGNSRGVILSNQIIEAAGLNPEIDIMIHAADGIIYILQVKSSNVNTDLSTWDKQFKSSIKKGSKPESDLFDGVTNDFDLNEW